MNTDWMKPKPGAEVEPEPSDHDEPNQLVDLSLPFTQFRIEDDEGDLVIAACDGETEAVFGPGVGGLDAQINGAERAAEAFARYLALLLVRRGDRRPLPTPEESTPVRFGPSMNVSGL